MAPKSVTGPAGSRFRARAEQRIDFLVGGQRDGKERKEQGCGNAERDRRGGDSVFQPFVHIVIVSTTTTICREGLFFLQHGAFFFAFPIPCGTCAGGVCSVGHTHG